MFFGVVFFWSLVVTTSFLGWGFLVNRRLVSNSIFDFSIGADLAIGTAAVICILSILNLFGLISIYLNYILVFSGIVFLFLFGKNQFKELNKIYLVIILFFYFLVSLRYFHAFVNIHDDSHGYLNLVKQALSIGSLDHMQFNERSILTLGGGQLLQGLYVSNFDLILAWQTEALGSLIIFLLLGFSNGLNKKINLIFFIVSGVIIFGLHPHSNSTPLLLSAGMLMILLVAMIHLNTEKISLQNILLMGLLAAEIISLKLPYIAFIGLAFVFYFLFVLNILLRPQVLKNAFSIFFATVAFLSTWMIFSYLHYGTFLFPYLGRGYHMTAIDPLFARTATNVNLGLLLHVPIAAYKDIIYTSTRAHCHVIAFGFLLFLGLGLFNKFYKKNNQHNYFKYLILTVAALIVKFVLIFAAGTAVIRYSYPFDLSVLVVILYFINQKKIKVLSYGLILGIGLYWMTFYYPARDPKIKFDYLPLTYNQVFDSNALKIEHAIAFEDAQKKIPEGENIFVFADEPMALDFTRNPTFICDAGASLSLPPGMSLAKTKSEFIDYMKKNNIHYLIYSKNEANYQQDLYRERLLSGDWLIKGYTQNVFELQNHFKSLMSDSLLYQNDHLYVFKL